jgi:aspartyl/asparaginyl-tRNA synthetase
MTACVNSPDDLALAGVDEELIDGYLQVRRRGPAGRGMGADRLPSFLTKLGVTTTETAPPK